MGFRVELSDPIPEVVDGLLRRLPSWFGIESANADYVDAARRLPTLVARADDGGAVGILLSERHFPGSVEIHLMAVDPAWHRCGVGRALVDAVAAASRSEGVRILTVKTLGPSDPDPGYADTRAFYVACGFEPVEELTGIWGTTPCLLMVMPL